MNEFKIIERFFMPISPLTEEVVCGIGDDAAVIQFDAGNYAISVDSLVEGVHFPPDIRPEDLGYRSASVTLSDLAAMASIPKFATIGITMPDFDAGWLQSFTRGLGSCLKTYDCLLIGGDTTKGPLVITLQVIGLIKDHALKRSDAKVGDLVGVSGTLGDARAALDFMEDGEKRKEAKFLLSRFLRPTPRIDFALKAQKHVNAAIDISDGLLADLEHVAEASNVQLEVVLDKVPLSPSIETLFSRDKAMEYACSGGDDYELAFTFPPQNLDVILEIGEKLDLKISIIGRVINGTGIVCVDEGGKPMDHSYKRGYQHF